MPLGREGGADTEAFDRDMYQMCMAGPLHEYRASCNFMWIDFSCSAQRNIPIAQKNLQELRQRFFEGDVLPASFPFEIVIAVSNIADPIPHPSGLKRCSPEECEHAWLLWMADVLAADNSPETKAHMRRMILSVPMRFKELPTEESRMFENARVRERLTLMHKCTMCFRGQRARGSLRSCNGGNGGCELSGAVGSTKRQFIMRCARLFRGHFMTMKSSLVAIFLPAGSSEE